MVVQEASLDGEVVYGVHGPDGSRIVTTTTDGQVSVLDAESLEPVDETVQLETIGGGVVPGPDNQTGLQLTHGYLPDPTFEHFGSGWQLVDLETGDVVNEGTVDFDTAFAILSPDGRRAAIGGFAGEVVILDLETGQPVRPPAVGHSTQVWTMRYSPDGSRLVTTGEDGSVSLWDGSSGELLGSLTLPEQVTASAQFARDGRTVLIATDRASVYRWDTSTSHALDVGFAPELLAVPFPRQRLLGPLFITGLQVELVLLDILDDVFLLDLPLKPPKGVFNRFALLDFDFSHATYTPFGWREKEKQRSDGTTFRTFKLCNMLGYHR